MVSVCVCCLSADRKLSPIGEYWPLFNAIVTSDVLSSTISSLRVCWECKAHLRKFSVFQETTLKCLNTLKQYCQLMQTEEPRPLLSPCESKLSICILNSIECIGQQTDATAKDDFKYEVKTECMEIEVTPDIYDTLQPSAENNDSGKTTFAVTVKLEEEISRDEKSKIQEKSKKQPKPRVPISRLWSCELVSEETMLEWRRQDENEERYKRLHRKCTSCLVAFNYEDQMRDHDLKHHHESLGPHTCDICQSRFPTEQTCRQHRLRHMQLFKCRLCAFSGRGLGGVTRHLVAEHGEATWRCDQCGELFKTASQLRYHKDKHTKRQFKCRFCDKAFRIRNNMYTHMLIKHKDLPKAKCPVCGKLTRNKYSLKYHMKTHCEPRATYYCELCKTQYESAQLYKQHLSMSMKHLKPEDLKFECEECGRRFVTDRRRKSHHSSVHLKKGQFPCTQCAKSYSTNRALTTHVAQKHENSYVEPPRDKICDVCGKGFTTSHILSKHMRSHTGERPFKCHLCEATFGHSSARYTHNKLVHEKVKRKASKKKTEDE